jgi:3'(2'), 5'-bisphosphate nucleotidase
MWEMELQEALAAASLAAGTIMEIYARPFEVTIKSDDSPVTIADQAADEIISNYLRSTFPNHAFLTEESNDDLTRLNNDYVWIIDPIDGTKDFIAKNGEFTINIALSYKHEIVVGVVMLPALNEVYFASKSHGSYKQTPQGVKRIHVNDKIDDLTVLFSRFHVNEKERALVEKHRDKIKHTATFGSCLKACRIASGLAEITYRCSGGTKEWDTAASQIIVEEAGGLFVTPSGARLTYNRSDVYNRDGYIIVNRRENILL